MLKSMKKVRALNRLVWSNPHGCVAGIFCYGDKENRHCACTSGCL